MIIITLNIKVEWKSTNPLWNLTSDKTHLSSRRKNNNNFCFSSTFQNLYNCYSVVDLIQILKVGILGNIMLTCPAPEIKEKMLEENGAKLPTVCILAVNAFQSLKPEFKILWELTLSFSYTHCFSIAKPQPFWISDLKLAQLFLKNRFCIFFLNSLSFNVPLL